MSGKNQLNFPTDLIKKCYQHRKINVSELTNEQIRLLISQNIATKYLIGLALEKLERNVLTKCDFYEGDLLVAVSKIPTDFWSENQTEFRTFKSVVESNSELLKDNLEESKFNRIKASCQHGV